MWLLICGQVPEYLRYSAAEVTEVLKITERKPTRVGIMAQAERRQQEQKAAAAAAAATAAATAAGAGKPPVVPRPAAVAAAAGAAGVRPSQSMVSLAAAGTSYVSGLGEEGEGEEEVVGGAYDDIEEEVVDDRNIDEEFERQLEQQEGQQGSQSHANSKDGTPGKQQQQRGSTPQSAVAAVQQGHQVAAAGGAPAGGAAARQQSPFAALQVQQPQQPDQQQLQQLTPSKPEGGHRVMFADQQQQQGTFAAAAGTGPPPAAAQPEEDVWEDVGAPPAVAAGFSQPMDPSAAHAWQQQPQQHDWQQQQQVHPGATGGYYLPDAGQKRPWDEAVGMHSQGVDGMGGGAAMPAVSGGPASSNQQPSASTGGQVKKIRLKMKGMGGSQLPAP